MKVYAHYYNDKEVKNEYRWRTLLQFGTSWNIIGSVVMKNPGSSSPLKCIGEEILLDKLHSFSNEYEWFEFSADNTMQCIEALFRSYYKHNTKDSDLNGVIQVFNLMNVKDPNLELAIERNKRATHSFSVTIDSDVKNLVAPVYLGWGGLGFSSMFIENAKIVFKKAIESFNCKYLTETFEDNVFYHPQYLMTRGKNQPKSQYLFNAFCQNTRNPEYTCTAVSKVQISKSEVYKKALEILKSETFYEETPIKEELKLCRFKLNKELEITITTNEKGYVGIRHFSFKGQCKYSTYPYPNTQEYRAILEKYKYKISQDAWIGQKSFNSYNGDNVEEVVNSIVEEVTKIKKETVII